MSSKVVVEAVEARLGATWNGIVVVGSNTLGEPPPNATEFLMVQFPLANTERLTVGQARYREEGAFRIVLHTARGFGASRALALCDQLALLFRDQTFGGVVCQVPGTPFIDDSNDRGNFFQVAMVFPYTFNF